MVSAGDAGANAIAIFRRYITAQSRTRLFSFVHIATHGLGGFPVPELYNIDFAQVEMAAKAVAENADVVLGIKVRMSENVIAKHGTEPLKRAIPACEMSGTGAKLMVHIGGKFTNIVQDGKLLPAALAAKKRGVVFDVGHGGGSFDYTVAEASIAQGAGPDVLSSDIHVFSGNSPGMPYLTWVMSKFLNLGFSLEQVIAMATINPAKVINRIPKLGTLQPGAPADVTVLDVVEGAVEFVDTRNNRRQGRIHIKPAHVVLGGVPHGRPYLAPFSVC